MKDGVLVYRMRSPSSRRAWIEMVDSLLSHHDPEVALLAEGVDRNQLPLSAPLRTAGSPSSRRAWIEIFHGLRTRQDSWVALLAEGVDRNRF